LERLVITQIQHDKIIYLHGQLVACVGASVDDVECWHWHHHLLDTGQIGNMAVKRNPYLMKK
jgi:hypothetical protein